MLEKIENGDMTHVSIDWFSKDVDVLGEPFAMDIRPIEVSFIDNETRTPVCDACTIEKDCNDHREFGEEHDDCGCGGHENSCACDTHGRNSEVQNMAEEQVKEVVSEAVGITEREFASMKSQLAEMKESYAELNTKHEEAMALVSKFQEEEEARKAAEAEARVNFDDVNDRVSVEMLDPQAHKLEHYNNHSDNDWYHGEVSHQPHSDYSHLSPLSANPDLDTTEDLFFGDADKTSKPCYHTGCPGYSYDQWTKSAYLNKQVFGAMLKNESKSINSNGSGFQTVGDNAGAIVTWEAIDNKDRDFMMDDTTEPTLEYMTWGVWGMAMSDSRAAVADAQPAAVHMGTWYAGDLLDPSDWPTEAYTATLAGMAMFDVFARLTDGSTTQKNYHWTEGTGVTGSVVFEADGRYTVSITAENLGKSTGCSVSACEHGINNVGARGAIGTVTWTSANNMTGRTLTDAGVSSFSGLHVSPSSSGGVSMLTKKEMQGHLFGTKNDIEVGANLRFLRETNRQMIMYSGTAILSE